MIETAQQIKILGVSDVSLGYGSPQMPTLVESLAEHYAAGECVVLEPDQPEFRPQPQRFPRLRIERLATLVHPHCSAGLLEYNRRAAQRIDELAPDVLIFSSPTVLPAVLRARSRPRFCIYYMLESLSYCANDSSRASRFVLESHRQARSRIDLLIFPEENRAAADIARAGYESLPLVVCYNSINRAGFRPQSRGIRMRRLFYSGSIDRRLTMADFFVDRRVRKLPIDLWGVIYGPDKHDLEVALQGGGETRYRGYVDSLQLAELRPGYAYSLVMWSPINENTFYACPNKFFEAIADGVPPICTPHPQCKMLIERYDCGILLDDWTLEGFLRGVREALRIFKTPRYDELVANCRTAAERELNWDCQFAKIRPLLPVELDRD